MTPEAKARDRAKVMAGTFVTALADVCPDISESNLNYIEKQVGLVLFQAQSVAMHQAIREAVEQEREANLRAVENYDANLTAPEARAVSKACNKIARQIRQRDKE